MSGIQFTYTPIQYLNGKFNFIGYILSGHLPQILGGFDPPDPLRMRPFP